MKKVNAIKMANSLIENQFSVEVVKSDYKLEDYSQEDLMKLLLTKISSTCHKSDCLVSKANVILNTKLK